MLKVEENYVSGIPQTVLQVFASPGVGWHWTAGGTGRAGWDGTVSHLIASRYEVNASYHGGFWHEHATETTVLQWIVRTTRAAHSVNPADCWKYHATKSRATQDARFAEVRRILGAKASDPNAGMLAVAHAGMPADLERDLACEVFRADVQNIAQQLVAHPAVIDRPHFGHGWIQPLTRYEMDVASNFIGLLYGEEASNGGTEMTRPWRPRTETWTTGVGPDKGRFMVGAEEKHFTEATEITTCLEQVEIVNDVVTTPLDRLLMALYPDPAAGPEVLVIPRTSLTNPRNGRPGLPTADTIDVTRLQGALDTANTRTASVKTSAAASLRKGAAANRDTAAGLEAAAKNVETL